MKLSRPAIILVLTLLSAACSPNGQAPSSAPTKTADDSLVAQVASYDLAVGEQRFMVGLLTKDQKLVGHGTVEMRFGYLGDRPDGTAAMGAPVTAKYLPIPSDSSGPQPVKTAPEIVQGSSGSGVYAVQAGFDKAGFWGVQVTAELAEKKPRTARATFEVAATHEVATVGQDAPRSENLTVASTDAPIKAVDSRAPEGGPVPDPELHSSTVAQAINDKRPVLVAVTTPVYCVSRFCGPITDMVAGLASKYSDRAVFTHIEVWRDFEKKEINRAAAEWIYKGDHVTEPWVFLVGADGKVVARWDNVATAAEIEPMLQQLPKI